MAKNNDMAGFAEKAELGAYKLNGEAGEFYLGRIHKDHGTNFDCGISQDDERGVFIMAASRSGKGVSVIIPNLLQWHGGVFCIDPKGENATITAMRRATAEAAKGTGSSVTKHLGQKVAILDPMGVVKGAAKSLCVNYDPLSDIHIGSDDESEQIMMLVSSIVMEDSGGSGSHFTESVATIFAGAIEAILHGMDKKFHTISTLVELMRMEIGVEYDEQPEDIETIISVLERVETPAGLAQEAASVLRKVGPEEAGSFSSTASRQLKWMFDPRMKRHVRGSSFSLVKAIQENWSVYVCIPPNKIPRQKRWLRMLTNVALNARMEGDTLYANTPETRILFMLDEFNALGHFQIIEDAAGYMAGYGIKLVPVIQNIGQVKKHYEKNWETFLGNAGAIIGFGLNDLETEQYLSDRMGKILVWEESLSSGGSKQRGQVFMSNINQSKSASKTERAVRWANEIHSQGVRDKMRGFVIPSDTAPFTIERRNYWETFGAGYFDSPKFVEQWEKKHAR